MAGKVNWHGDRVRRQIEAEMGRRLKACGQIGADHAKVLISVDGTGVRTTAYRRRTNEVLRDKDGNIKTKRLKGGDEAIRYRTISKKAGSLIYGANPSKPGEPPHVQTGRLRASVAYEVAEQVARIGTNVIYGRHLELGTSKMAPRPWLRRMLVEMTPTYRAILTAPIRGSK